MQRIEALYVNAVEGSDSEFYSCLRSTCIAATPARIAAFFDPSASDCVRDQNE